MGTVKNGNKWSGVCVNGKVVSGLVKNGVVFYKKAQALYKRRIMAGDNLKGKIIYPNFYTGFKNVIINEAVDRKAFISTNDSYVIQTDVYSMEGSPFYSVSCRFSLLDSGQYNTIYYYQTSDDYEHISNGGRKFKDVEDIIITDIVDSAIYRNVYIEDPNIRPLQVGDKIVSDTKIYFNFPDNIYSNIRTSEYIIKINKNDGKEMGIITYWSVSSLEIDIGKITYNPNKVVNYDTPIYVWVDLEGYLYKNSSFSLAKDLLLDGEQLIGTVSEINQSKNIYKYILVDETTLGV